VILPRTNIGVRLEHEAEALVLERGDAVDIAAAIRQLAANAELHARVAKGGRAFAHRELTWPRAGDQVESLYREVLEIQVGDSRRVLRSTTPTQLPTVLTRGEVRAVLNQLNGATRLIGLLL